MKASGRKQPRVRSVSDEPPLTIQTAFGAHACDGGAGIQGCVAKSASPSPNTRGSPYLFSLCDGGRARLGLLHGPGRLHEAPSTREARENEQTCFNGAGTREDLVALWLNLTVAP